MSPTLLVVEDEPAIQELIRLNLELANYNVICANNFEEAIDQIDQYSVDLLLVDWMLPGPSGLHLLRKLRSQPQTQALPIIVLTAKGTERDKVEGLDAGADDYITKPFSPKELLARVRAVLRRRNPELTDETITITTLSLNPKTHEVQGNGHQISLGPTEFRLLRFFMTHPDQVFTRAQLLNHVWGEQARVEERTVDVHIRRLRKALKPTAHDEHIQTIHGTGYRFRRTPQSSVNNR